MPDTGMTIGLIEALGSQPDPEDVAAAVAAYLEAHPEAAAPIDDTAGEGDTNKIWSADKSATEVEELSSAIVPFPSSASAGDVGKFLKAKTVSGGKVTEYELDDVAVDPEDVEQAVSDWLTAHPEATTTVQDGSITKAKLASDVTADLSSIKDNTGATPVTFTQGGYINTDSSTVNPSTVVSNQYGAYAVIDVTPGDVFTVWGTGFGSGFLWCWLNSSNGRIDRKQTEANPVFITAPANAAKLVLNAITSYTYGAYKGKLLNYAMKEAFNDENNLFGIEKITLVPGAYIKTNDSTINASSPTYNTSFSYAVLECSPGARFTVWGNGASYAHLYSFIDNNGTKLLQAQALSEKTVITAPPNTTKVVLNNINGNACGFYKGAYFDNSKAVGTHWSGKTVATYGDSITWYDGQSFPDSHSEYGTTAVGYQEYLKELGITIVNKGESGSRMTGVLSKVKGSTFTTYDAITITCGANDFRYPTTEPLGQIAAIGSTFDETTMYGALQAAIEYAIAQKPSMQIILMTPIKGWNNGSMMSNDYAEVFRTVGELYSIPVCDWYAETGINSLNKSTYIGDNETSLGYALHPTNAGFKRMGEMLKGFFAIH